MKIRINEIPDEGLILTERFDPVAMNLQMSELRFVSPLNVTANFHKDRNAVFVRVDAGGNLELTCGRCLEIRPESYGGHFDLGYSVENKVMLDVTDDIRQEILTSYPAKFVCKEECLGLCARCGKNLNEGMCGCQR